MIQGIDLGAMSTQEIQLLHDNIDKFSVEEQKQILVVAEEFERRMHAKRCRDDLLAFCQHMDPEYIVAAHHRKLAELLMDIAMGRKDRIAVSIPPRHGKSHLISTLFPAWFLGKFPNKKVLMASHTGDLAVDFGRKVRNLIASEAYQNIFPGISLAADSKSAGRWSTNKGGEYFACGVGASIAGRGADLLLVDDPHSEQDLLAGNFDELEKAYKWFTFGARTRLMSGGRIAVVHCMVGDTKVLLADGQEKVLRNIRPGEYVAGYSEGRLVPAKVLNWANQGPDRIYTIKTTSGRIIRANWKHPLLVNLNGEEAWVKIADLKVGMNLVGMCRSPDWIQNAVSMGALSGNMRSENAHTIITKTEGNCQNLRDPNIGGSGVIQHVQSPNALNQYHVKGFAYLTTIKHYGETVSFDVAQKKTGTPISNIGTELVSKNTIGCLQSKTENALFVDNPQHQKIPHLIGRENSAWTTATADNESEHYSVTPATSLLVETQQKRYYNEPLSTYAPTLDQIVEITLDEYEDVFDIQVEGTENFIAEGIVSHNTRWHQDDLIGHLLRDGANNVKADQYEPFEFPAIVSTASGEKALWPEKFDLEALERTKASMPAYQWNAQYMQSPTAEEAAIIKREWWKPWKAAKPPHCDYIIMALDAAAETHNRADFTALLTFGVFSDDQFTDGAQHIILLNSINIRVEFPELKDLAFREWKDWEPDAFIVEKKSAGTQLYQELRRAGIPVQEFTPSRNTGDKVARVNAVADILRSGMVWYPEGRRWADEVIEQCVAFPYGSHDDLVDCVSMALARFRQGGFIELPGDWRDPEPLYRRKRAAYY